MLQVVPELLPALCTITCSPQADASIRRASLAIVHGLVSLLGCMAGAYQRKVGVEECGSVAGVQVGGLREPVMRWGQAAMARWGGATRGGRGRSCASCERNCATCLILSGTSDQHSVHTSATAITP